MAEGDGSPTPVRRDTSALEAEKQAALAERAASEEKARAAEAKTQADRASAEENIRWLAFHGGKNDEIRRVVKQYSASVGAASRAGWTALHMAAWHGNTSTCCVLVDEFGADTEAENEFGWTPLMAATLNARLACMKELIVRRARLDARCRTGKSPKDYAAGMRTKEALAILEAAEREEGMAELRSKLLPAFCFWFVVSCPVVLQEEVLEVLRAGRCNRAFAVSADGIEGVRVSDEQWKSWRSGILNAVLGALKGQSKTTAARIIFMEDRGSKMSKDEWGEWVALKKGLDFQLKSLQKERDLAHAQAGGEGEPPVLSVELWGDAPMTMDALRESLSH